MPMIATTIISSIKVKPFCTSIMPISLRSAELSFYRVNFYDGLPQIVCHGPRRFNCRRISILARAKNVTLDETRLSARAIDKFWHLLPPSHVDLGGGTTRQIGLPHPRESRLEIPGE